MAKKAFEGIEEYDYKKAFSISPNLLQETWKKYNPNKMKIDVHSKITGQQKSLYTEWRRANPNKALEIDELAKIEIQGNGEYRYSREYCHRLGSKGIRRTKRKRSRKYK